MTPTYTVASLLLDHDDDGAPRLNVGHMFSEGNEGTLITSDNMNSLMDQGLDKLGRVDVYVCSTKMSAEEIYRMKAQEQSGVKRLAFGGTADGSGVVVTWDPKKKFEFCAHDLRTPSLLTAYSVETFGSWMLDNEQCRNIEATVGHVTSNGDRLRRATLNSYMDAVWEDLPYNAQADFIQNAQLELEEHIHGWATPIGISVDDVAQSAEHDDGMEEILEHVSDGDIKAAIREVIKEKMKHSDSASTSDILWEVRSKLEKVAELNVEETTFKA